MKHPFWLVNDLLLALLLLAIGFVVIFRQKSPRPVSLASSTEIKLPKKTLSKIDLGKIYNNDIFETYNPPVVQEKQEMQKITMPEPPTPKPVRVPLALPAKFLDPLQISLKGVITFADETDNVAMIQDTKTATTKNYKVNDKLDDAQLIRILGNKIILIRSNGQQETVYVNQYDAELDQQLSTKGNWAGIIQKQDATHYVVDPYLFVQSIATLAEFIDQLNLITVYKKGTSVGCRVGILQPKSIGYALGLQPGDIIEAIDQIPATTTDSRYEIYQKILGLNLDATINVEIARNNQKITLHYMLQQLSDTSPQQPTIIKEKTAQEIQEEKTEALRKKQHFAPTLEQMKMQQKRDIVNYGNHSRRNLNVFNRQP